MSCILSKLMKIGDVFFLASGVITDEQESEVFLFHKSIWKFSVALFRSKGHLSNEKSLLNEILHIGYCVNFPSDACHSDLSADREAFPFGLLSWTKQSTCKEMCGIRSQEVRANAATSLMFVLATLQCWYTGEETWGTGDSLLLGARKVDTACYLQIFVPGNLIQPIWNNNPLLGKIMIHRNSLPQSGGCQSNENDLVNALNSTRTDFLMSSWRDIAIFHLELTAWRRPPSFTFDGWFMESALQ